ncbi:MAG: hypothetical protein KKA67_01955 [Spirochaetes bacterium]|nr:hypothetical protein [Spirochaetota bacterium]MBU1079809.1 hypothetical protein [Spirochaetota bacterium]
MNKPSSYRAAPPLPAIIAGALALLFFASCSVVFRSSIQGTVIDSEAWADGTTTGVGDAKVFLYTDLAARDADYAAYVDGDDTTLPDGSAKTAFAYFQSTVTDADGAYDFTGFIWEKFFSEYGKTADRAEVYLLIYHPDYGIWKNPVPLFVVSDVTNQLPQIAIEDLWNEGRLAGTVLDWKDDKGLAGVAVNFYVAESWSYDESGNFTNIIYPTALTSTATTDNDGRWVATVRFPMKPNRTIHASHNNAPVRILFVRENYRANDPADGTDLDTMNASVVPSTMSIDSQKIQTDKDVDRDGLKPSDGDYEDAFILVKIIKNIESVAVPRVNDITMQRWRFSATARGRVSDGAAPATRVYYNGIEILLTAPAPGGTVYRDISSSQTVGETTTDGHFDLGTVTWEMADIVDIGDAAGNADEQENGKIAIEILVDENLPTSGGKNRLEPDVTLTLELVP